MPDHLNVNQLINLVQSWMNHALLYPGESKDEVSNQGLIFAHQLKNHQLLDHYFSNHSVSDNLLGFGCYFGLEPLIDGLIELGADVNLTGGRHRYNSAMAALLGHNLGQMEEHDLIRIWDTLFQAGLDLEVPCNSYSESLIHQVCAYDFELGLNWLLSHGVNPSYPNQHGSTPLHYAVGQRNNNMAHLLLNAGAKVTPISTNFEGAKQVSILDLAKKSEPYDHDLFLAIQARLLVEKEQKMLEKIIPHSQTHSIKPRSL